MCSIAGISSAEGLHWPQLLTNLGQMLGKNYDSSKDVAAITSPTLLVFGDADAVRTAHAVKFFELLGAGQKDGWWMGRIRRYSCLKEA